MVSSAADLTSYACGVSEQRSPNVAATQCHPLYVHGEGTTIEGEHSKILSSASPKVDTVRHDGKDTADSGHLPRYI